MLLGDKFYAGLNRLKDWQQALFALCLTERMAQNLYLYCESTSQPELKNQFTQILDEMWKIVAGKVRNPDLESLLNTLEKHMPEATPDGPYGAYPAMDAANCLDAAICALLVADGDEAFDASGASVGTVARFLEVQNQTEYTEEELYDFELIQNEIEFQVNLAHDVKCFRTEEVIMSLRQDIRDIGCSNLGIERE